MTQGGNETLWSGLESPGMIDAKCSLLLQEEVSHEVKIKTLPKQRVLVYQDRGFNPASGPSSSSEDNYYVDFPGATILQLEPTIGAAPQTTMPVTLTVGGRCVFTPENYQDFRVMMRTKEQSREMSIAPNGSFDWPDVQSLLLCPCCSKKGPIPRPGDKKEHEYWLVFYPLLQITVLKGTQLTLGTRTICRLVCLNCMEDLLDGLSLKVLPGGTNQFSASMAPECPSHHDKPQKSRLAFSLPVSDVLAEAGSASFLEDGPQRPETHPHVDDILDAWTLYNLWEHSGAWEALQNDYRMVLARSMHADPAEMRNNAALAASAMEARLKDRMGRHCGNPGCDKVHGTIDTGTGEVTRLYMKCRDCHSEFYCSKTCREVSKPHHEPECLKKRKERDDRREKKARKVECDTCQRKFPYTKMKKCSNCRIATYCSVDCQRADWQRHKFLCRR